MIRVDATPIGLYVHFPWCIRKCPYCDFNSHPVRGAVPERAYIDRLLEDLRLELAAAGHPRIETIFIGGGTPSLCSGTGIQALLDGVRASAEVARDPEITLEANPGAIDRVHFAGYRAAGVNRISIGAQSFEPTALSALGRVHAVEDIAVAVATARDVGLERLNLDLMYGLPGQSVADALADLERALALDPGHLSWYQLTIEPKTPFARRPPPLPADDVIGTIEAEGLALLSRAGYRRYEVSAFAGDGGACRHNVNYWRFGDYLGIGAGAHGKRTVRGNVHHPKVRVERTVKPLQPRRYLDPGPELLATAQVIAPSELPVEFMMNALRLTDGVPNALFEARTGLPLTHIGEPLARLRADRLMRRDRLGLTLHGFRFLDSVVAEFLPRERPGCA